MSRNSVDVGTGAISFHVVFILPGLSFKTFCSRPVANRKPLAATIDRKKVNGGKCSKTWNAEFPPDHNSDVDHQPAVSRHVRCLSINFTVAGRVLRRLRKHRRCRTTMVAIREDREEMVHQCDSVQEVGASSSASH
ncbi:hypothetical protein MRB53_037012 [Persea americana]|nr:hypothetical protein MRB53_037012 [Persea americana]